jgi:hypothetical protein
VTSTRGLILRALAIVAIPAALFGALIVAGAIAGLYMVMFEGAAPGEPIWMDALAPSTGEGVARACLGGFLIAAALLVRRAARQSQTGAGGFDSPGLK